MLEVQYKTESEFQNVHSFANVALAAFITAYGRIELYNYIKDLGKRLLYVDTDSLVYIGDGPKPGKGLLGDLCDEIYNTHKVRDSIQLWVGTGAKSYGYRLLQNPEIEVCKVKGITLNYETSKKINLESMKDLLMNGEKKVIKTMRKYCIKRNKATKQVTSETMTKTFRITNDKRVLPPGSFDTLPYGHKDVPAAPS
jgi:hypothetical protein